MSILQQTSGREHRRRAVPALRTTWMDVFAAVSDAGADDAETLAVVTDWIGSGRLRRPVRASAPAMLGAKAWAPAARPF